MFESFFQAHIFGGQKSRPLCFSEARACFGLSHRCYGAATAKLG